MNVNQYRHLNHWESKLQVNQFYNVSGHVDMDG